MSFFVIPPGFDAIAYETLAPAASTGFTAAVIVDVTRPEGQRKVRAALVTVTGQPCRFRIDSGTPTASVGNVLAVNDGFWIMGHNAVRDFRIIETTATASVQCTFFV